MSNSALLVGFFVSLGAVVVTLVVAIAFAKKKRIPAHVKAVGALLVCLVATLGFAEALGQRYTFEATSHDIHMPIAFVTALGLGLPLVTGMLTWKGKVSPKAHKVAVAFWLLCVVAAVVTGLWMLSEATPKEQARLTPALSLEPLEARARA